MAITLDDVKDRLASLGYTYVNADEYSLEFAFDKTEWHIKNVTNQSAVPEGLEHITIDMICGEFLSVKKGMGQLTGYDFERIVQSVKEGDVNVSFTSASSPEQQFDAVISYFLHGRDMEVAAYRKLVW